jgi:hypothetical protein
VITTTVQFCNLDPPNATVLLKAPTKYNYIQDNHRQGRLTCIPQCKARKAVTQRVLLVMKITIEGFKIEATKTELSFLDTLLLIGIIEILEWTVISCIVSGVYQMNRGSGWRK